MTRVTRDYGLDQEECEMLWSFFAEPIFCSGNSLGNGQHRVCAMKLAKVPRCPYRPIPGARPAAGRLLL